MSAAAASSASSIFENQQGHPPIFQQSFLPDTISEFGATTNSTLTLLMAANGGAQNGPTSGFPVSCSSMLSMGGTPSNYIFSSMVGGGDHSDHSSNSSSRTRLAGLGNSSSINDSGLSTLSSTTGCGNNSSTILIPAGLLSSTPVHHHQLQHQLQQQQQGYSPDSKLPTTGEPNELDDFEAVPRDRCNTWPLRRPTLDINAQTSPLIHDRIPEEDNAYDESSDTIDDNCDAGMLGGEGSEEMGMIGSPSGFSNEMSPMRSDSAIGGSRTDSPPSKKSTTRRNAWGNMSYADLITQAILNSPDKRLTLSQVYEWMVQNVPYFRDKGDSNSSAGWKLTTSSPKLEIASEDEEVEEEEGVDTNPGCEGVKKKRIRKRNPETVSQKKPNPWGEESYSDLIARALGCTPDGRLKLNEIYQWFADNIPYFGERSSQEEAQGWKNSIRHNLSLHSRFMRIQNEGAGKSSWWVINPDAKPGRNPRRRAATMETATKGIIDKKRRGARKRVEMGLSRGIPSAGTSVMSSQASILSQDYECDDVLGNGNFETFRPRTQSTLSIPGTFEGNSSRVSPTLEPPGFEDFDFPPWMDALAAGAANPEHVTELLDRTDQMRLDVGGGGTTEALPFAPPPHTSRTLLNGVKLEPGQQAQSLQQTPMDTTGIKQEPMGVAPPPSYQELNSVRGTPTQIQNALLRGQVNLSQQSKLSAGMLPYLNRNGNAFNQGQQPSPMNQQQQSTSSPPFVNMVPSMQPPQWASASSISQGFQLLTNGGGGNGIGLPQDLESLAMPTDGQSIMLDLDMVDMDAVLRHELSQTRDHQLNFDLP